MSEELGKIEQQIQQERETKGITPENEGQWEDSIQRELLEGGVPDEVQVEQSAQSGGEAEEVETDDKAEDKEVEEKAVEKVEEKKEEAEEEKPDYVLDKFKNETAQAKAYVEAQKKITEQGQKIGDLDQRIKESDELLDWLEKSIKGEEAGDKPKANEPVVEGKKVDPDIKKLQDELSSIKRKEAAQTAAQTAYAEAITTYPDLEKRINKDEVNEINKIANSNQIILRYLAIEGRKALAKAKEPTKGNEDLKKVKDSISRSRATVEKPSATVDDIAASVDLGKLDAKSLAKHLQKLGVKRVRERD